MDEKITEEKIKAFFLKKYEELAAGNQNVENKDDFLAYCFVTLLEERSKERGVSFESELNNPGEAYKEATEKWLSIWQLGVLLGRDETRIRQYILDLMDGAKDG